MPAAAAPAAAAPNADHIRQLTEMGFPEDQATAALRAAQGNPDVAVEFLMTGIPDNVQVNRKHLHEFATTAVVCELSGCFWRLSGDNRSEPADSVPGFVRKSFLLDHSWGSVY